MDNPLKNKFLILKKGCIRSEATDEVIVALDTFFKLKKLKSFVTRIVATPEDQLKLIKDFLIREKLAQKYPAAMKSKPEDKISNKLPSPYVWQKAWSNLLHIGILINPPLKAEVLMNYIRDGKNKRGEIINPSYHETGLAFDIGGQYKGVEIINKVAEIIDNVKNKHHEIGIRDFVIEHKNNCVHVDVEAKHDLYFVTTTKTHYTVEKA